jgi:hypothetical protein
LAATCPTLINSNKQRTRMAFDTKLSEYWDEPLETALAAIAQGMATAEELQAAAVARRQSRPAIGRLAITQRKLTMAQAFRILGQQAVTGELFGDIAVQMGFLDEAELHGLLQRQATLTPALSDVLVTQGVLTPEEAEALRGQIREHLRGQPEPSLAETAG